VPLGLSRHSSATNGSGRGVSIGGSVPAPIGDPQLARGPDVAERLHDRGVRRASSTCRPNAIDFIARNGVVHPIQK
jgi:hypothetical protein